MSEAPFPFQFNKLFISLFPHFIPWAGVSSPNTSQCPTQDSSLGNVTVLSKAEAEIELQPEFSEFSRDQIPTQPFMQALWVGGA